MFKFKTLKSVSGNFTLSIIVICTLSIIISNYIFNKKLILDFNKIYLENEYRKTWWEENYNFLIELQKKELLSQIDVLKKEDPNLVKTLMEKWNSSWDNYSKHIWLKDIDTIKSGVSIRWNTWALVTIIEYSDLECEHCIDFHNSWILDSLFDIYGDDLDYIFKNFPLEIHKNSKYEALASKCVESLAWSESYFSFIDFVFSQSKWWGEWFDLDKFYDFNNQVWINKEDFDLCLKNENNNDLIEREFWQWIYFWVKETPSFVILNNLTGEYNLLSWYNEIDNFEEIIDLYLK